MIVLRLLTVRTALPERGNFSPFENAWGCILLNLFRLKLRISANCGASSGFLLGPLTFQAVFE